MIINTRMDIDEYFIKMARLASLRGACVRRQVGCILTNNLNHVLATGYNGRARGVDNCYERPCSGSKFESGLGLESCEAIHAEANALLQCKDVQEIRTVYCTTAPCIHCVKLLMNTGCTRIVFQDDYPQSEVSQELWLRDQPWHSWEKYPEQFEIFPTEILHGEPCDHKEWFPSTRRTVDDNTIYRKCADCGILKEVQL